MAGDAVLRQRMAAQGRILVDGLGVERIVSAMVARQEVFSADDLNLRLATAEDRVLLWQWANDPVVRRNSFDTQAIDWPDHDSWCAKKFASAVVGFGSCKLARCRSVKFATSASVATRPRSVCRSRAVFAVSGSVRDCWKRVVSVRCESSA